MTSLFRLKHSIFKELDPFTPHTACHPTGARWRWGGGPGLSRDPARTGAWERMDGPPPLRTQVGGGGWSVAVSPRGSSSSTEAFGGLPPRLVRALVCSAHTNTAPPVVKRPHSAKFIVGKVEDPPKKKVVVPLLFSSFFKYIHISFIYNVRRLFLYPTV